VQCGLCELCREGCGRYDMWFCLSRESVTYPLVRGRPQTRLSTSAVGRAVARAAKKPLLMMEARILAEDSGLVSDGRSRTEDARGGNT
jgi:hypothetical protein